MFTHTEQKLADNDIIITRPKANPRGDENY